MSRRRSASTLSIALLLSLSLAPIGQAQELERILGGTEAAGHYSAVEPEILDALRTATAAGIPEDLLSSRLREGVEKRVAPDLLIQALKAESERLVTIMSLLRERGVTLAPDSLGRLLSDASLALRAGVTVAEFRHALGLASGPDLGSPNGETRGSEADGRIAADESKARAALRAVGAASLLAAIDPQRGLDQDLRNGLLSGAIHSSFKTDRLASLFSVFVRGRALGLPAPVVARLVSSELESGASLVAIDRALTRLGRKR